jgi:hypothetical protein
MYSSAVPPAFPIFRAFRVLVAQLQAEMGKLWLFSLMRSSVARIQGRLRTWPHAKFAKPRRRG